MRGIAHQRQAQGKLLLCRSHAQQSYIKQRILLNIALNAGVQVYLVLGTLLGWSPLAILAGCMVLGISALALYIDSAKAMGRFMEAVMGGTSRMSQGDLTVDVPTAGNNVTAREGLQVMQSLQDTLRQMMATLRDGSNEVNIAATERERCRHPHE